MQIELSDKEAALLRELLDDTLRALREEVYKTEATDWKRALKEREHLIKSLQSKLAARA